MREVNRYTIRLLRTGATEEQKTLELEFLQLKNMDLNLDGRTALITGGSRGIGYGAAELLAAEGCNLHLASCSAADLEAARIRLAA